MFWNLLTNAIKFTSAGGKIVISLEPNEGYAQVRVIDEGIGIESEFLPNVFERFTQAESSITRQNGGIGLVNVKRRLELLYPGRHELNIEETEKTFSIKLNLRIL